MTKLIILGAGGHAYSVIDAMHGYELVGLIGTKDQVGQQIYGVPVIGDDQDLERFYQEGIQHAFVAIGGIQSQSIRKILLTRLKSIGYQVISIVDPTATLSQQVKIGMGVFIGKNALVNADVVIEEGCIINSGAIVEHNCHVKAYGHVATGAIICGNVVIGQEAFIGAGSVVIQNITVGNQSIIGAGSVVTRRIKDGCVAYGSPCKIKEVT